MNKPLTMDVGGNLRICNHSPVDIGNIYSENIENILSSPYVQSWKEIVPQFCSSCNKYAKCQGGCRAASEQLGLSLASPDPIIHLCTSLRSVLKYIKEEPMIKTVRWGVLGTAKIAREKMIPGIRGTANGTVEAIASRNLEQAENTAKKLNIAKAYGTYAEMLADPEIDAVYIPLPNNLHIEWAVKAVRAGKHVLCEKPVGLTSKEALELVSVSRENPGAKVMEAFMYRFHPQWVKAKALVDGGAVGNVKTVQSFFSYYNADPQNIRNKLDAAGGALMDIGCYCVSFPRFLFGTEPVRVVSSVERDPVMKTDRLTSAILDFPLGRSSTFTCSTQLMPYQRAHIFGDTGHIEIEIPVNAPKDTPSRIILRTINGAEEFRFDPVDQYALQAEAFAAAILADAPVPTSLMDAVNNMKAIEALFRSEAENGWSRIE